MLDNEKMIDYNGLCTIAAVDLTRRGALVPPAGKSGVLSVTTAIPTCQNVFSEQEEF